MDSQTHVVIVVTQMTNTLTTYRLHIEDIEVNIDDKIL